MTGIYLNPNLLKFQHEHRRPEKSSKKYLSRNEFKIMKKENFYMIELIDKDFDVRAYFSNPPLSQQLNIR